MRKWDLRVPWISRTNQEFVEQFENSKYTMFSVFSLGAMILAMGLNDASKFIGRRGAQMKFHFHDWLIIKPFRTSVVGISILG